MNSEEVTKLYRKYVVMVRCRAMEILRCDRSTADDVAQEVFIKFLRYSENHAIESSPAALLYTITQRVCINRMRKNYQQAAVLRGLGTDAASAAEPSEHMDLQRALQMTGSEEARIGAAYYVDGSTLDEIAASMQLSQRTVERRLHSFREKLRKRVKDWLQDGRTDNTHD